MDVFTVGASNSYDVTKDEGVAEAGGRSQGPPPPMPPLTKADRFKLGFLVVIPCAFFLYAVIYMSVVMQNPQNA